MKRACREYRDEWLRDRTRSAHLASCSACTDWTLSTAQQIAALTALARQPAPARLGERLERELAGDRGLRLERVLGSLMRQGAPSELDELVAADLTRASEAAGARARGPDELDRGERNTLVVGSLDVQPAPPVLERLLEEELRDPAAAVARRFSGSLERLRAPAALERRLDARARRRALLRRVVTPFLTAAAAVAAVWFVARSDGDERRPYSFEVVRADALRDPDLALDPMARQLASILGGGAADIGGPR